MAGQRLADEGWPVSASHSRTVRSSLPEASSRPSGLNATLLDRVGVAGQRLADGLAGVGIPQPHGAVVAAGDDAAAVRAERHAASPRPCGRSAAGRRVGRCRHPTTARCRRSSLALPETIRLPSGLNATLDTMPHGAGQRLADRLAGRGVPQPHVRHHRRRRCGGRRG